MLAYTYVERGKFELQEKQKPALQDDRDAIIRVTLASICTSDLHIRSGAVPRARPGVVLGHEFVGVVEAVGNGISNLRPGDRVAACNLGYLYETGVGVAQSWADAVKWYRQAVEESEPRAQYNLAWCYEHGKGVPRDLRQARELYQAAAKQGYAGAQEAADRMEKDGSRRRGGGFLRGFLDGLRGQ